MGVAKEGTAEEARAGKTMSGDGQVWWVVLLKA